MPEFSALAMDVEPIDLHPKQEHINAAELELGANTLKVQDYRAVPDPGRIAQALVIMPKTRFVPHVAREIIERRAYEFTEQSGEYQQYGTCNGNHPGRAS